MAPHIKSLDRTDRHLLKIMSEDARRSNKEIAAIAGIAPSTCSERIQRLKDGGVFRGFHADVDPEAMGIGLQALVVIRLRKHSEEEVQRFWGHAEALPETIAVYHLSGANDFLCHVAVKDPDHLRQVAVRGFTTLPEVAHIETSMIFEHRSKPGYPNLIDQ